jgi:hypothetical protein
MPPDQPPSSELMKVVDPNLEEEVRFISEWEGGRTPFLGAIARVRQVYRAHPLVGDHR